MNFQTKLLTIALLVFTALNVVHVETAMSEETLAEKTKEAGRDVKRGTNKAVRKVKDETCELVNGKMECAAKKVKHSILNTTDKVEDAVE